ncbi:MAG TPA: S9 family peptidase, partial [Firmicutes bacterium]|nr:S9 family peptidase [Bacillota bacterium]
VMAEWQLASAERITMETTPGWEIEGWLMKPVDYTPGNKYPLILHIHGGPHATYGYAFMHEFQLLAANGYGVLYTNPRGSRGYGEEFTKGVVGDWGGGDYADLMSAVDYAVKLDWVDESRLGVTGGSYGGYMTNWIVTQTDRFKGAVTLRSISNMYTKYGCSDIGWYGNKAGFGGRDLWDSEDFIMERSPIRYAPRVKTPILIIHSEEDYRCPMEQAEQWYVALKRLGVTTEFVRFAGENHELSRSGKPRNRIDRLNFIVGWFERFV